MENRISSAEESVRRLIDTPRPHGLHYVPTSAGDVIIGVFEPDPSNGGHIVVGLSRDNTRKRAELTVVEVSPRGEIDGHRRDIFESIVGEVVFDTATSGANPSKSLLEATTEDLLLRLSFAGESNDPTQTKYQRKRWLRTMHSHGEVFPQPVQAAADIFSTKNRFKKTIKHARELSRKTWRRVRHSI